jgi:hypothetical protein
VDYAALSSAHLSTPSILRRALHASGSGLALTGVVFLGFRLHAYWLALDLASLTVWAWCSIAVSAVIYGSANMLLVLAWRHLLQYFGAALTHRESIRIYGMSQLGKYVPGNIFHLAGRQALGMAAGVAPASLLKSTIWELGLMAMTGALSGWMILPLLFEGFPQTAGVLLLLASSATIAVLLHGLLDRRLMLAFFWQTLFFLVSGAIFIALLNLTAGRASAGAQHWLMIGGAYIAAWLAGFLTPGAPAGVGVRELVLLFLLKGVVAEADLLMAVLLGRVVTVVGDLLFFALAFLTPAKFCLSEKYHV